MQCQRDELFARNIALLDSVNPALASRVATAASGEPYRSVLSRSGHPVLRIGNLTFHSLYDPVREGLQFAHAHAATCPGHNADDILIYGFGFAYHIRGMLQQYGRAHVYEPDVAVLRCACEHVDLTDIVPRVQLYTEPDEIRAARRSFMLLPHRPSCKHTSDMLAQIAGVLQGCASRTPNTAAAPTTYSRILVVTPVYGGSLPIAHSCYRAFQSLGHDVRLFDASIFNAPLQHSFGMRLTAHKKRALHALFMQLMSEMIVAACEEWTPDLVFGLSQAPISIEALKRLRQSSITTAFWFVEDHACMPYWKQYAPHYDIYFTIQDEAFHEQLHALGVLHAAYLPLAADPAVHAPLRLSEAEKNEFGSAISFMGEGYFNRKKIFTRLLDFDFKIWGTGWDEHSPLWRVVQRNGQRIDTGDTAKIFNAAAININLHSSVCQDGITPWGDYVNPRTFEIASCGAFQLVDQRSYLSRHFSPGTDIIVYTSAEELRDSIRYYLERPDERAMIAKRGRIRVEHDHTYAHRMQYVLDYIQSVLPARWHAMSRRIPTAGTLERFCKLHPEVAQIFASMPPERAALNIETIADCIRRRQMPLGRAEATFMLMNEYHSLVQERSA
jgi:spore maturation protein CgeB